MNRLAYALAGALALAACLPGPARADEPPAAAWKEPPAARPQVVYRTRTIVRRVVVERPVPVYRTRRVVREVVVERPVYLRPRPVYREVIFDAPYGPPPFAYGPPPFRPRPAFYGPPPFRPRPAFAYGYGPGFGPYPPFRPRPIGWGWGPDPYF